MTLGRAEVGRLLRAHGIRPSRALGQNFVVDPNTVRRVARLAGVGPGDRVLEIGAGLGCLTLALVETGASVTALEVDRHVLPALAEVVGDHDVDIVEADATRVDWAGLLGAERWVVVANLPYNVGTPLLADLLDDAPQVERFVVMVQREVAERLVAAPGTKAYGALSVKVASWARARIVGQVSAEVFVPRPRVDSSLVELVRHPVPVVPASLDREALMALVRAGFAQRRKMLRRVLRDHVTPEAFEQAAVAPTARAEELDLAAWMRLAQAVQAP